MQIYTITESPVLVRKIASADSGIVNVLPVGSKLYVLGEESGWYRTTSGYYVFKTDNIILDNEPIKTTSLRSTATLKAASSNLTNYQEYNNNNKVGGISNLGSQNYGSTKLTDQDKKNYGGGGGTIDNILTNDVKGKMVIAKKVVLVDSSGKAQVDPKTGKYVWINAPASLSKDNNGSIIQYVIDGGKNIYVEDKNGKKYIVEGSSAIIKSKNSSGSSGKSQDYSDIYDYNNRKQSMNEDERKQKSMLNSSKDMVAALTPDIITQFNKLNEVSIDDARTVFGMPYQFMPIVDPRLAEDDPDDCMSMKKFGRKYKEKIVARAPVFVIQPGLPVFMKGFSDDEKKSALDRLLDLGDSDLDEVTSSQGEYYSFELRARDYFYAVNSACRAIAVYLGIQDVQVPGLTKSFLGGKGTTEDADGKAIGDPGFSMGISSDALGSMNWSLHPEHPFGGYYAGASYFYINSDAQVSENFSTGTRQSELAGKINQISDAAMETLFLTGLSGKFGAGGQIAGKAAEMMGSIRRDEKAMNGEGGLGGMVQGLGNKITDKGGLMNSIINNIGALLSGGKLNFPEIWQDSSVGRSYNVTIKLDSPDCDKVSIYLNIIVPLIHILGFVLPRFAASNTYITPFLVRCFYKSMFHIDMGMITSCDVVKGDMGAWTQSGLPTQIIVNLQIKDLYSVLSQSTGYANNTLLSNPAQLEYLASICGISVAPPKIGRSIELYRILKGGNRLRDQLVDVYNSMVQSVFRAVNNIAQPTRWQN